jgi:membrane-associated progesterone receptor component
MAVFDRIARAGRLSLFVARAVGAQVKSKLSNKPEPPKAPLPVAEARDYTRAELSAFDGKSPDKPVLLAIRGSIYDVTRGRSFYGAGGPYEMFAGRDCTRALAKMSFADEDFVSDETGLTNGEVKQLEDWIETFESKYTKVGSLLP